MISKPRQSRSGWIAALFLAVCVGAAAFYPRQNPRNPVFIKDVRIFDGEKVIPHGSILIEGGRIAAIGPAPATPPEYGPTGLISDFEKGKIESSFGAGWMVSNDLGKFTLWIDDVRLY